MESWTLEEMRSMKLPTTAWIVTDGQPARPVILRSVNTRRGTIYGLCEELRVSWVTEQARYATAEIEHIQNGTIRFFPVNPDSKGVT